MMQFDIPTLEAAMRGFEYQKAEIERKMWEVNRMLRGKEMAEEAVTVDSVMRYRHKRHISAAGRKAMAAAQKRRWAAYHKAKQAA